MNNESHLKNKTSKPNLFKSRKGRNGIQTRIFRTIIFNFSFVFIILIVYKFLIIQWQDISVFHYWLVTITSFVLIIGITSYCFQQLYLPVIKFLGAVQELENKYSVALPDAQEKAITPDLTSINYLLIELKNSMDREYKAKILKKQAEIEALQSQINPHFLYNTLEAIRGQATLEDKEEIANMVEALSAFFRYSISQRGSIVTLEDELNNVDNYFAIQQFRFGDKFSLIKKLDEDVDLLKYRIPKLTIQPIVENAIYHGLETKIGKGTITIRVNVTQKRLVINVIDDGIGIKKLKLKEINEKLGMGIDYSADSQNDRSHGIAMFNVNQRIILNYGDSYGLTVYSSPELGTNVEIGLPLIKEE